MLAWQVERLIHVGAEAEVSSGLYLGLPAIMKIRKPRSYRNPQLDRRLTTSRMMAEARMLSRLSQSSLPVPNILACEMSKGMMVQSLMPGKQIVDILRNSATDVKTAMRLVGNAIRQLHSVGAIHGDLTTNNLLWDEEFGVSIIDFGLSNWGTEIEKMGLDLQVLSECLSASHPEHENALKWVFEGYLQATDLPYTGSDAPPSPAPQVIERYKKIRSRVRYHA